MPASDAPVATRVMTACASDGEPVFTGHRMRPNEFAAVHDARAFRCSRCNAIHRWTVDSAWCEARPRFS